MRSWLKSDPTNKFKKEFVSNLKDMKDRKVINHALHDHGLPKVQKPNMPIRPIVNSYGTILYQCA